MMGVHPPGRCTLAFLCYTLSEFLNSLLCWWELTVLFCCFRVSPDISPKWYKFDDGEVSECKMDDDEVLLLVYFFVCN